MAVRIRKIQVSKLGPLHAFQENLGQLNLFYGRNETGKTYLVEFLLQSLFRQAANWDLRESAARGSIVLEGLAENPVSFSPGRKRKLEDFWEDEGAGLPLNMARLLIVKGGELALASGAPGGVTRDALKRSLTGQALLDEIWESIQPTVRKATLEDGKIRGNNQGKIKTLNQLESEIHQVQKLIEQIDENYSRGPACQLELQLERIQSEKEQQNKAKGYLAYRFWKELEDLTSQKQSLDESALINLRERIRDYRRDAGELASLKRRKEEIDSESRNYIWLEGAIDTWIDSGLEKKKKPASVFGIAGLSVTAAGLLLLIAEYYYKFTNLFWAGIALAVVGFGITLFYGIKLMSWSRHTEASKERQALQESFQDRFAARLRSLADLKEQEAKLQEIYLSGQAALSLIVEKSNQLNLEKQTIENIFAQLTGRTVKEEHWDEVRSNLADQLKGIKDKIADLKLNLGMLNVAEDDYQPEPAVVEFDPEIMQALNKENEDLQAELARFHTELETLKALACGRTGDEPSASWQDVYYHLKIKANELNSEYIELKAQLIAEIGLTAVLTNLRAEEDQKIVQALNSSEIAGLIQKITGKYQKLDLIEKSIYVHDAYTSYALQDLSTGAQEQIQLALRLGFAARVCGGDPLFLILDDAFQHSDWQRREALVQSTLDLAKAGWQILYLSMDDHIRDLYLKIAKPALKKGFKLIELL